MLYVWETETTRGRDRTIRGLTLASQLPAHPCPSLCVFWKGMERIKTRDRAPWEAGVWCEGAEALLLAFSPCLPEKKADAVTWVLVVSGQ